MNGPLVTSAVSTTSGTRHEPPADHRGCRQRPHRDQQLADTEPHRSFSRLEHGHEVQPIDAPPDQIAAAERRNENDEGGDREGRGPDDRWDLERLIGMESGYQVDDDPGEDEADRDRDRDLDHELGEQDPRHLGAGEAEHAQAGELPCAFLQGDAGAVVDHPDRDDYRKTGQDAGAHQDQIGDLVEECGDRDRLHGDRFDGGQLLDAAREYLAGAGLDEQRRRRHGVALASEAGEGADLHIGTHAEDLFDDRRHHDVLPAAAAFENLDRHLVARTRRDPIGEAGSQRDAVARRLDRPQLGIARPPQLATHWKPDHRGQIGPVSGPQPRRNDALALHRYHPWLVRQIADDARVARGRKRDRRIAAFHQAELNVHHVRDGIPPEQSQHHHGHREGDAHNREGGAPRSPGHVAQDHCPPGAEAGKQTLHTRMAKPDGRRGAHRHRGRERHNAAQRRQHAERSRREADRRCGDRGPWGQLEREAREAKEAVIARDHGASEAFARRDAEDRAEADDDRGELEIVNEDRRGRKAERLERRDLLALRHDQSSQRHVEQKGRDPEKDAGHRDRHERRRLSLTGAAGLGGTDKVTFLTPAGDLYAMGSDSVLDLAKSWNAAEFNIFGDGNATEANFSSGSTILVKTSVDSGTTSAPSCVAESFTGETDNLNLVPPCCPYGGAHPAIEFMETNAANPAASCTISGLQAFTTLVSFNNTDGANPYAGLVQATNGDFYGTTYNGGGNHGNAFKITPSGTVTTLYSFCSQSNCTDGANPNGELVQATNRDFYGTTVNGGGNYGTVFKITPAGTLTTLASFNNTDDANPYTGLVQATNGDFYGTTASGGYLNLYGTVFKITPAGTLTTLYDFCAQSSYCADGDNPYGALVQATNGDFYGTTVGGGVDDHYTGSGTIFEITSAGTLTTLYRFCSQSHCPDGSYPYAGLVRASNGDFYGTTWSGGAVGGGTVFKITPAGTLTTLYSFCSQSNCADGAQPSRGGAGPGLQWGSSMGQRKGAGPSIMGLSSKSPLPAR